MAMSSNLTWSRGRLSDAQSMLSIYNETVLRGGHLPMTRLATLESTEGLLRKSFLVGYPIWTFWCDDQMVGWSQLSPLAWGGACTQKMGDLSIYVNADWYGRGVAAQSVFIAFYAATRLGFESMTCWILGTNLRSVQLARACGMARWGVLPKAVFYKDENFDVQIWGCHIDDPVWRAHMLRLEKRLDKRSINWLVQRNTEADKSRNVTSISS